MTHHLYCIAGDLPRAHAVMTALTTAGVPEDRISVLSADRQTNGRLARDLHAHVARSSLESANIGGAIGWLAGLGTLAIPGIGLFVAAGPVLGMLAGVAVGASLGTLRGTMVEAMGIPDERLPVFEEAMNAGRIVIAARIDDVDSCTRAVQAIREAGAQEVGVAVVHPAV
jgi:hypothetical protein